MKKILGLDISSSTIGWALFEHDDILNSISLIKTGHLKPIKKEKAPDLSARLSHTQNTMIKLIEQLSPDEIVVEDYAKRFSAGRSTANVIIILSVFNELICLLGYNYLKAPVHRYPVVTIRATLGKFFEQKIVSKDDIYPVITAKCTQFKPKFNKKGKPAKESWDEADAVAVTLTHFLKTYSNISIWNL